MGMRSCLREERVGSMSSLRRLFFGLSFCFLFVTWALSSATMSRAAANEQDESLFHEPPQSGQKLDDKLSSTNDADANRDSNQHETSQSNQAHYNATKIDSNPVATAVAEKGKRAGGTVFEYVEPGPLNVEARAKKNLTDNTSACLCGIVKDAEAYLDEWVDYHFGLGFHSIYLIDNSDKNELVPWQNKRRAAGYTVQVLHKPGTHRQMYGYHMCASEFKNRHTYMAFFDVDEYLVLKKHGNVADMLVDHLPKGSLTISWYIFGSSQHDMYSPLPITKRFQYRDGESVADRHPKWADVKSILKLADYGSYPKSPHSMKTNKQTTGSVSAWRDTNGAGKYDKIGAINSDRPLDVAVLHHYRFLSAKEYHWKTCVRKTVDDQIKGCNQKPYEGKIFDDSAWQTMKKNVPKYRMFDEFEDFM